MPGSVEEGRSVEGTILGTKDRIHTHKEFSREPSEHDYATERPLG